MLNGNELNSLKAYNLSLKGDVDGALELIKGKDDPDSINKRLAILIDCNRYEEALGVLLNKPYDTKWCSNAIHILLHLKREQEAERILEWTRNQNNKSLYNLCLVRYVATIFKTVIGGLSDNERNVFGSAKNKQDTYLVKLIGKLMPLYYDIDANNIISNEIESETIQLLFDASYLLGDSSLLDNCCNLLKTRTPIPLKYGYAVLNGVCTVCPEIPERLLRDHPNNNDAKLLSIYIEGLVLRNYQIAFDKAINLFSASQSKEEKRKLFMIMSDLSLNLDQSVLILLDDYAKDLFDKDDIIYQKYHVNRLIMDNKLEKAESILLQLPDEESSWRNEALGDIYELKKVYDKALTYYIKACSECSDYNLYLKVGQYAHKHERYKEVVNVLEKYLARFSANHNVRINLIYSCIQINNYKKALDNFEKIPKDLLISNHDIMCDYAKCCVSTNQIEKAIGLYNEMISTGNYTVNAVLELASLLHSIQKNDAAFDLLDKNSKRFWESSDFVGFYMRIAFIVGQEQKANQALLQLKNINSISPHKQLLKQVTIDELKTNIAEEKQKSKEFARLVIEGKMQWLLTEQYFCRPSLSAWKLKTQELFYLSEETKSYAEYCLYSTNGFTVKSNENKAPALYEIQSPKKKSKLVVDITSLITMSQLGILDLAIQQYFENIIIPAIYSNNRLYESSNLVFPQKSQILSKEDISSLLFNQKIKVMPRDNSLPCVSEYVTTEETQRHCYRLIDVLNALQKSGNISENKYQEILTVARQKTGVDDQHPVLSIGMSILFDLSTLELLHSFDILLTITELFNIYVSEESRDTMTSWFNYIKTQKEIQDNHNKMWNEVLSCKKVTQKDIIGVNQHDSINGDLSSAATLLSLQENIPMLVDDRVCQMRLNNHFRTNDYAFGTDVLLLELLRNKIIDIPKITSCYLSLMMWRYRFIVPTIEMMKQMSDDYKESLPGKQLILTSKYLHECMKDPGLFSGIEETSPPTVVATRLLHKWTMNISEFLVTVWADESYKEENLYVLTEWVCTTFLPSAPENLPIQAQNTVGKGIQHIAFNVFLLNSPKIKDIVRANKAIRLVAEGLGIYDDDYLKEMTEVIDGIR